MRSARVIAGMRPAGGGGVSTRPCGPNGFGRFLLRFFFPRKPCPQRDLRGCVPCGNCCWASAQAHTRTRSVLASTHWETLRRLIKHQHQHHQHGALLLMSMDVARTDRQARVWACCRSLMAACPSSYNSLVRAIGEWPAGKRNRDPLGFVELDGRLPRLLPSTLLSAGVGVEHARCMLAFYVRFAQKSTASGYMGNI
eukprot:jgi/Mesvir1/25476/Mv25799-RA.1